MTVEFLDTWTPNGPFAIARDTDILGGLHVVADLAAREAIVVGRQKVGMRVAQVDTGVVYRLNTVSAVPNSNWDVDIKLDTELIGGFRVVADNTTRNNVPQNQQKTGMQIHVQASDSTFKLVSAPSAPPLSDSDFEEIKNDYLKFGEGYVSAADGGANECAVTTTGGVGLSINTGTFFDITSQRVVVASVVAGSAPAVDGEYIVAYDKSAGAFVFNAVTLDRDDFPLAVVSVTGTGTSVAIIQDVRRRCAGLHNKSSNTVGGLDVQGRGHMFTTLRAAIYYACCYTVAFSDTAPVNITINEDTTEALGISFADVFLTDRKDTFEGVKILGNVTSDAQSFPRVTWTHQGPLIDFDVDNRLKNFEFERIEFMYTGGSAVNADIVWVKNPSAGFNARKCLLNGGGQLSGLFRWTRDGNFGGWANSDDMPVIIDECNFHSISPSGKTSIFSIEGNHGSGSEDEGLLIIRNSKIHSLNGSQFMFDIQHASTLMSVMIENTWVECAGEALFNDSAKKFYSLSRKVLQNCIVLPSSAGSKFSLKMEANDETNNRQVKLLDCQFRGNVDLEGAYLVSACEGGNNAIIHGNAGAFIVDCDFHGAGGNPQSTFHGDFASLSNCKIALKDELMTGTVSATASTTIVGTGTLFLEEFSPGDWIEAGGNVRRVVSISTDTAMIVNAVVTWTALAYHRIGSLIARLGEDTGPRVITNSSVEKFVFDEFGSPQCSNMMVVNQDKLSISDSEFFFDSGLVDDSLSLITAIAELSINQSRIGFGENNGGVGRNIFYVTSDPGVNVSIVNSSFANGEVGLTLQGNSVFIGNKVAFDSTGFLQFVSSTATVVMSGNRIAGSRNGPMVILNAKSGLIMGNHIQNLNTTSNSTNKGMNINGTNAEIYTAMGNICEASAAFASPPAVFAVGISSDVITGDFTGAVVTGNIGWGDGGGSAFDSNFDTRAYGGNLAGDSGTTQRNIVMQYTP